MLLVALLVGLCMPTMALNESKSTDSSTSSTGSTNAAEELRYYTFNAVSLNVDGLPREIAGITINGDGTGASGAARLAACLRNENWDIIALQEDFNYHNDFYTDQISHYYSSGSWGGHVTGLDGLLQTDGLGLLVADKGNYLSLANETKVRWNVSDGGLFDGDDGQYDELIRKGFRYYEVAFAPGIIVDVYTLHMDAGSRQDDIDARESQLRQLADYVIAMSKANKRPALIMGDTNCRYTREDLEGGFIDYINDHSDNLLTITDGWIESVYSGEYPEYGGESLMLDALGERLGEVVDKIFYINYNYPNTGYDGKKLRLQANSYRLGVEYGLDHDPIIINFTLVNESAEGLSQDELEEKWTADELVDASSGKVFGSKVQDGQAYFLKNLEVGKYLKSGGKWGTQTALGSAAMPITFEKSEGKYKLRTTLTEYDPNGVTSDTYAYMNANQNAIAQADKGCIFMNRPGNEGSWSLEEYGDAEIGYYYVIVDEDGMALTASNVKQVSTAFKSDDNDAQKWVLLTEKDIRDQMVTATNEVPYDITPLLKGADFDLDNTINSTSTWGSAFTNYHIAGGANNDGADYNYCAISMAAWNATTEIKQSISDLPIGNYVLSGNGFYRSYETFSLAGNVIADNELDMQVTVTIGGQPKSLERNNSATPQKDSPYPAELFRNGSYSFILSPSLSSADNGTLELKVSKAAATGHKRSYSNNTWVCIDNFKLLYKGEGSDDTDSDPYAIYKNIVIQKMNETYKKVLLLNEAGQNAYDISVVVYRLDLENNVEEEMVKSYEDAMMLCDMIDEAYANALAAHQAAIMGDVIVPGTDITNIIFNPSFEEGKIGWTNTDKGAVIESAVAPHENKFYEGANQSNVLVQTVSNLVNGLYELTAYVNSSANTTAFLVGNSYHKGFKTNGAFQEKKLLFLVEDGQAKVGVIGGAGDANKYYYPSKGAAFKVDYFRFKYISDVPTGRVKLAVADAKEIAGIDENGNDIADSGFDVYAKGSEEFTILKNLLNNCNSKTYTTADAAGAVSEIYASLQAAAKKQKHKGADMTYAITNPNFELDGNYPGWTTVGQVTGYETKVALQDNLTYAYVGVDGRKLYNTWDNPSTGVVGFGLTQTVEGLPTGSYKLSAMVASGTGESITLTANGVSTTVAAGADQTVGVPVEVQCEVEKGGDLVISVAGANNAWFKADDFRLEYIGHAVELDQLATSIDGVNNDWYTDVKLKRAMTNMKWHTFVVPFDIPADVIASKNWDVRELYETTIDETGFHLTLKFRRATKGIKAGVSYMVRYYPGGVPSDDNTTVQETAGQSTGDIPIEHVDLDKSTLVGEDADGVSTKYDGSTEEWGSITFAGTYVNETILPDYAFYVSNNKFYLVNPGDNIKTKGYRGYFVQKPNPSSNYVRSLGMRSEDATLIESVNNDEVKVVGIYDVNGVRREEMQDGINIVKMSDGSSVKIFINE